jgi:hypothetical protein
VEPRKYKKFKNMLEGHPIKNRLKNPPQPPIPRIKYPILPHQVKTPFGFWESN